MLELAGIGGFILLVLDIWAILSTLGSAASNGKKALWIALIVFLPLLGLILWLFLGPRSKSQYG